MEIKILGWSYENIRRFKNLTIDLLNGGCSLPHITLVMMRNGTGKTTTIQLIRAVLNGSATNWSAEQVREFRPKDKDISCGKFCLNVKFDSNTYFFSLLLNYDEGVASYQTSRISTASGGLEAGRILPVSLNGVFDTEEFVNRFIFDGEQAKKALNSSGTEAENAIRYLYRVDKIDGLIDRINKLIARKQAEESRGQTQQSVRNNKTRMENRERKLKELKDELSKMEGEVHSLRQKKNSLEQRKTELLHSNERIRAQVDELKIKQTERRSDLVGYFATIKARMREPFLVHPVFDRMLKNLAENMQTLKLPKTTAREFFRELSTRPKCICGHDIGPEERDNILQNAEQYLGEEDLVAINAIKDRIRNYNVTEDLQEVVRKMIEAKNNLEDYREALARCSLQLDGEAQQEIEQIEEELGMINRRLSDLERNQTMLCAPANAPGATDQNNIALAQKAYDEAFKNYYTALGTYEYTMKAQRVIQYMRQVRQGTLLKLKTTIVEKTNEKIEKIVTDEHIVVEKIDGNLVLQGRAGVSEGQTLAIAYAYICSLFEHSTYDFPFVIDSPAASMDLDVRREVAQAIPQLFKQLIIFVTSGEVAGFAEKMYQLQNVHYITIEGEHDDQAAKLTIGQEYFSTYQSEEGEEE